MKFNKEQGIIVVAAVFLTVALLFANTAPLKLPKKEVVADEHDHAGTLDDLALQQISLLSPSQRKFVEQTPINYDSVITFCSVNQKQFLAAYYSLQKAKNANDFNNWYRAGDRLVAASRFMPAENKNVIFSSAIIAYQNAVKLDSKNIEARISLAASLVEGSSDPMQGITMLREIEKTDSNNVNLQLSFAYFSEKSGQYDKVIKRFNKVLSLDPRFIEAYLHLADAYEKTGNKSKAIESLQKYSDMVNDESIRAQVQSYIDKLKNS